METPLVFRGLVARLHRRRIRIMTSMREALFLPELCFAPDIRSPRIASSGRLQPLSRPTTCVAGSSDIYERDASDISDTCLDSEEDILAITEDEA